MGTINFNNWLDTLKTKIEALTVANGYSVDIKLVKRKIKDPASWADSTSTPLILIMPLDDQLVRSYVSEERRKLIVWIVGYDKEAVDSGSEIEDSIMNFYSDFLDLISTEYKATSLSDPLLLVEIEDAEHRLIDEEFQDAAFRAPLAYHYIRAS